MTDNIQWHYADKGERHGPFNQTEMVGFLSKNIISAETKVWSGFGDWVPLKDTVLSEFIKQRTEPPPLAGNEVSNVFIWAMVAMLLGISLIEASTGKSLWWLYLVSNITCCLLDERKLKAAGHKAPEMFWALLLVPVYVWQRAKLLNHKKTYFIAWVVAFVLTFFIGGAGANSALEKTACSAVSDIIKEQLLASSKCVAVKIDEEVSANFYKAHATLDNDNDLKITIEKTGDNIYVKILPQ